MEIWKIALIVIGVVVSLPLMAIIKAKIDAATLNLTESVGFTSAKIEDLEAQHTSTDSEYEHIKSEYEKALLRYQNLGMSNSPIDPEERIKSQIVYKEAYGRMLYWRGRLTDEIEKRSKVTTIS